MVLNLLPLKQIERCSVYKVLIIENMSESGAFYSLLIDPLLTGLRKRVTDYIEPDQKVVDVACGTGA